MARSGRFKRVARDADTLAAFHAMPEKTLPIHHAAMQPRTASRVVNMPVGVLGTTICGARQQQAREALLTAIIA